MYISTENIPGMLKIKHTNICIAYSMTTKIDFQRISWPCVDNIDQYKSHLNFNNDFHSNLPNRHFERRYVL
jgi:hypothetical protein